jgi:uncharacterized RDD family membrane protein YckC
MEDQNLPVNQETGIAEELSSYIKYEKASLGQRFLNFLIDNLFMRFGLSYLTGTVIGIFLGYLAPEYASSIVYNRTSIDLLLILYLVGILNYLLYYTFCEKVFKGYTLGKLITGTRAIRDDGNELTFKDAILRSLSRLVPFEALSAFGYSPWHDSWTKTTVIKSR